MAKSKYPLYAHRGDESKAYLRYKEEKGASLLKRFNHKSDLCC